MSQIFMFTLIDMEVITVMPKWISMAYMPKRAVISVFVNYINYLLLVYILVM